jgi:DNA-binding IclR family transcriptional regulator
MFPDGSFSVDVEIEDALQSLVQWGYLAQSDQFHGQSYLLTPAGLSYAARRDGTWDGSERRQLDRRTKWHHTSGGERRQVERRASGDAE